MIDKDRIFELFGGKKGDEPKDIEELITADTDFLKSPMAKLGMFTKMVHNHEVFHKKLKKFFQQLKKHLPLLYLIEHIHILNTWIWKTQSI